MVSTGSSQCRHAVHKGAPHPGELSTGGDGTCYVGTGTKTTILHYYNLISVFLSNPGEGLNARFSGIKLAAAVVTYDDSIQAKAHSFGSIGLVGDALQYDLTFPHVTDGLYFLSVKAAAKGLVHKLTELGHIEFWQRLMMSSRRLFSVGW